MFKCERKLVRKFALEIEKSKHCLCPTGSAKKGINKHALPITITNNDKVLFSI